MSKLFVPEIGTLLTLSADWTLALHDESRNQTMWDAVSGDSNPMVRAHKRILNDAFQAYETLHRENYDKRRRMMNGFDWDRWKNSPEHKAEMLAYETYTGLSSNLPTVTITIPTGTQLKVDRIYIRKGMADFSSITFNIISSPDPRFNPGKGLKGKRRFWAKLHDANELEFS